MRKIFSLTHRARKVSQFSPTARKNACQYHVTGMIMTAVILALLCGTSWAEIGRSTVERAWTKIAEADGFMRVPINFADDSDPNAWVAFQDEENFTVHVTSGLMEILGTEAEIAGVLGHELGHIRLGHYGAMVLDDTARTVMGINSELADDMARAVGEMNMDLNESAFSRKQETEADDYGTELLRKAGYNAWGLYDAMKRFDDNGYTTERNGFNSHPASRERLEHLSEKAGSLQEQKRPSRKSELDDIADILMQR